MHDAVVIGGGIIGLSTALELRRRGMTVLVVERDLVGGHASGAAAGMLAPEIDAKADGPTFSLGRLSQRLYPDWIASIEARTGLSTGFAVDGAFVLSADDAALEAHWASTEWLRQLDLRVDRVREGVLREQIPDLDVEVRGALYFPDAGQVDPRRLTLALATAARLEGVEIVEQTAVDQVLFADNRAVGVRVAGGQLPAGEVIVAAGAWSSQIPGGAPRNPNVFPIRGQLLLVDVGRPLFRAILSAGNAYVLPRRDGTLLIGSTLEQAGYDARVSVAGLAFLLERLQAILPDLADAVVLDHWAGIRPATADERPVIGRTEVRGLTVATGHFRNGVLWAPASARLVADAIEGKTPELDLAAFATPRRPAR